MATTKGTQEVTVKQRIIQRFSSEDFNIPVEYCETAQDVELLVAQDMVKVIDNMFNLEHQAAFLEKLEQFRTNLLSRKPQQRQLLGKSLTSDGVTYLFAILSKCIQENSGYTKAREARKTTLLQKQKQHTHPQTTKVGGNNLDFAVAVKSPAANSKFTFANGSRNAGSHQQSSYEYYEESAGEETLAELGILSPRGTKLADPRAYDVNSRDLHQQQQFEVYLQGVSELYELLKMDVFLLDQFKTSPQLLKFFYLTQLIISEQVDERDIAVNLSLLLFRFDQNTKLSDITANPIAVEILQKHNARETWKHISQKRISTFNDELPKQPKLNKQVQSKLTNYLSEDRSPTSLNRRPTQNDFTSPRNRLTPYGGNSALRRENSKMTQGTEKQDVLAAMQEEIVRSENEVKETTTAQNQVMMQNLMVLKDVIEDLTGQVETSYLEIDKLALAEQRMQENIDEIQQKFNFIRSKTETKLFASLPDLTASPTKSQSESLERSPSGTILSLAPPQSPPLIKAKEMLSPKNSVGIDAHVEILKRVQKLELATNRMLADNGKIGEGYSLTTPTASENAIALTQKKQIEELLKRIDDQEAASAQQLEELAERKREVEEMEQKLKDRTLEVEEMQTEFTKQQALASVNIKEEEKSAKADDGDGKEAREAQVVDPTLPPEMQVKQLQTEVARIEKVQIERMDKLEADTQPVIKDTLFQRMLLDRVQKLEGRSLEQILQLEKIFQRMGETESKIIKNGSKPANETQLAIQKAMKRIEFLERQELTARIEMRGPDEIYALNDTQTQIDRLVVRENDANKRVQALENMTAGLIQRQDEKHSVELKGMMTDLKSKFSFLDPNVQSAETKTIPGQVALLEEKMSSMQAMMMAHESDQSVKVANQRQIDEKLRSMTMRLHQTEEMLTEVNKKVQSGGTGSGEASNEMDVSYAVKIQMMEHRLNGMESKVETFNPVFLLTLETRLEDLHSDMIELRNLYSSPTSSLNMVLDGLLKKVKDLETSSPSRREGSPARKFPKSSEIHGLAESRAGANQGTRYTQLTSHRMNAATSDRGSTLKSGAMMQMTNNRGSLN